MKENLIALEELIRIIQQRRYSQRITNIILIPPKIKKGPAIVIGKTTVPVILPIYRHRGKIYTDKESLSDLRKFTQGVKFVVTESIEELKTLRGDIPDFRMRLIQYVYNHPEKYA